MFPALTGLFLWGYSFPTHGYCTDIFHRVNGLGLIFWKIVRTISGMETQRGPGRPPTSPAGTKAARIEVRAAPAEKEAFEQAAAKAGLSLSDWMREALLKAAKRQR